MKLTEFNIETLKRVRERIADPEHYFSSGVARRANYLPCNPKKDDAVAWSLGGALIRESGSPNELDRLQTFVQQNMPAQYSRLGLFEQAYGHAKVLRWLDEHIEALSSTGRIPAPQVVG